MLESAAKVLELYGTNNGILEVEYFDEVGTGLGPTLEFFSLVSKEFGRKGLGLWRDDDQAKGGNYVYTQKGWFPAPGRPGEDSVQVTGYDDTFLWRC
jgi:E3 ubiquitin-protein ligase TRIP12